ncbi:MAG: sodium:solute symporter family protein, partial [Candidatus Neomarinimicrobiota bacterium]|nr:sodium:solute symporter family protein [Candidatus Neomarinimicrobiota bacterium]
MNGQLHSVDVGIILVYASGLLALGLYRTNQKQNYTDYLLASRRLTLVPFTASLVATWYGGILGVGEFTYLYGISNWVVLGLPYYIFALLFAFFIAGRIRDENFTTIPDRLSHYYGEGAGAIGAGLVAILTTPAPYMLSCALLITFLFNISLLPAILITTVVSLIYIYNGGFRSVIRTDIFQFFLMFIGFSLLVITCFREVGGFHVMKQGLPELHLTWHGGNTTQYILVWFFIALWTFIDPGFYQRCAAAKSPSVAKRGILVSIGFWAIFDFLTLSAGLYSRLLLPEGPEAVLALPSLGLMVLPPITKGLFFTGLLATIMSTIDSFGFISGITIGRDILWRMGKQRDEVAATKIGLLITAVISLLLAWLL